MIQITARMLRPCFKVFDYFTPVTDLAARVWIAWIFFQAGWVKLQAWSSTVMLFTYQYKVPLLSPGVAAVLGTGAELILPVLLVLGLGGRIMIFAFFVYNLVAVISYHFLWTPEGWNGLADHISWALLLGLLMTHGPGKWSLDYFLRQRHGHHLTREGLNNESG